MRRIIFTLITTILLSSCFPKKSQEEDIQTINPNEIKLNEVVQDSLTKEQIGKIKIIQSTFADVYPVSLEETITNFKRDQNPETEITIWLEMVNAYKNYLNSKTNNLNLETKKEVFKLILSRSMMPDEEAISNSQLNILTIKDAKEVLSYYNAKPDPIDIVKKP